MKAIRNEDYLEFRGKKKRPLVEFSDSDSDFDLPPFKLMKAATNSNLKIRECIDLTASGDGQLNDGQMSHSATNAEFTKLKDVTTRIEKIEAGLSKSLEKQEELERVRRIVLCLEEEKRALERSIEAMKNHLNCIICKNLAKFPWLVSRCCTILMCQDCAEQWLRMESSCPHCRAEITMDTCTTINQIRAIEELISTLSPQED